MKTEMKRMNKIGISTAAVMLLLCVAAVMPVSAAGWLEGYGLDGSGSAANLVSVNISGSSGWGPDSAGISGNYYSVWAASATNGETLTYEFVCANGHSGTDTATYTGGNFQHDLLCAGDMPDLNVTTKYEEKVNGTHFNVIYTVKNIGTANATNASTTTIYVNGSAVATESCSALDIGENETKTVGPFELPCGTTVPVKVCADTTDSVTELDENNNCLENEYVCPACLPDMTITEKFEVLNGTNFNVTYTVKNIGTGNANASNTSIYIDGDVTEDPVSVLPAGNHYTNTVGPFACSCGTTVNVTVCADNGDVINESDETNNCMTNWVACPACDMPDLTITEKFEVLNLWRQNKVGFLGY